jgi:hypothetical protein
MTATSVISGQSVVSGQIDGQMDDGWMMDGWMDGGWLGSDRVGSLAVCVCRVCAAVRTTAALGAFVFAGVRSDGRECSASAVVGGAPKHDIAFDTFRRTVS